MRYRWLILWIVSLTLVTALIGCNGTHRYDSRLTAADSLMQVEPDSALALVMAVSPDSLTGEGDRAYRDLLLTQARYRCYIVATSDSDINRALAYYRIHSREREKLTRAYIYKGAVMDELGHPDSAMLYYKHAETTAAHDDYFNLGYSNFRIGQLYQYHCSGADSAVRARMHKAMDYFMVCRDTNYLIASMGDLGCYLHNINSDSAKLLLNQAISLAQSTGSPSQYFYQSKLAGIHFYLKDYPQAKKLAMEIINNGKDACDENIYYYYAARSFIKMGQKDSAYWVNSMIPAPVVPQDSFNYYLLQAELAEASNNMLDYGLYSAKAERIHRRILESTASSTLMAKELECDTSLQLAHQTRVYMFWIMLIAILVIIAFMSLLLVARKRINNNKKQIQQELNDVICALQEKQQQEQTSATELFKYRLDALNELFNSIKFKSEDKQQGKIRDIIPLSSVIMGLSDNYSVLKIELSDQFWEKMKRSVDGEYNGIVSFVENKYPELTLKERRLFCLLCANISPQIIRLCMNYTNVKSVTNNRSIIIKKKMGLDMTLEEFRDSYMKNQL